VKLQSESTGIPLIVGKTKGEKEVELEDLKRIIKDAKEKYHLDGIITGALFSTYQRDRIERICDSLSLKIFSPLWHINQETEMREIIDAGFEFIMTRVAAEGLDRSWLGRIITHKDVDRLAALNRKLGLNIAGEGGEFETLVLDGPIFTKSIEIKGSRIIECAENDATLEITKSNLKNK
jgi:asparagine synthase (glutamine-hydrolysing)